MLLAFFAIFLPVRWMAVTHEWLGLGEFPASPLVDYLTRSASLLYAWHGGLLLVLSPRIFANAFYNSKDIPFLSMYIIAVFTLLCFLEKKTFPRALIHALVCGILIDIRILGVMVPFFTFVFIFMDLVTGFRTKDGSLRRTALSFTVYIGCLAGFTILFWPVLWDGPVHHFLRAFREMNELIRGTA